MQGHTDVEKAFLIYTLNAARPQYIRLLLSLTAIFGFRVLGQDMTQAYLQSAHQLQCKVYVEPVEVLDSKLRPAVKFLKSGYGLPDAGDYWPEIFQAHLRTHLKMVTTTGDRSFFVQHIHSAQWNHMHSCE